MVILISTVPVLILSICSRMPIVTFLVTRRILPIDLLVILRVVMLSRCALVDWRRSTTITRVVVSTRLRIRWLSGLYLIRMVT